MKHSQPEKEDGDIQVDSTDVGKIKDELRSRGLNAPVDGWRLRLSLVARLVTFGRFVFVGVTLSNAFCLVSVVLMVGICWIQEREFRVVALALADFVFKLRRIGRTCNESCRFVNHSCIEI